jgi:hypothetical protein
MAIQKKKAAEKELFTWEFAARLKPGQSIASAAIPAVAGITVAADVNLTQPIPPAAPILDGTKVQAWIAGGTVGTTYDLECRATLNDGSVIALCGPVHVDEC